MFENTNNLKDYINVHISDSRLLSPYVDDALQRKIYPFLSKTLIDTIQSDNSELYKKIEKAVANYTLVCAIPFLKVNISNIGVNTFNDNKLKKAAWWDVRDYALSAARVADETLSNIIDELRETHASELTFLQNSYYELFSRPKQFSNQIYNIGNSYDVYHQLIPIMETVWLIKIQNRLSSCTIVDVRNNEEAYNLLRRAIGFYTIADAIDTGYLTFTTTGLVIQYEELPWQKSQVLPERVLSNLSIKLTHRANDLMNLLFDFIKINSNDFPCYENTSINREPIAKKSGLYF